MRDTVRLDLRPPFAARELLRFLSDRAVPGVETFDGVTFRRSIRTAADHADVIGLTPHPRRSSVTLELDVDDPTRVGEAVRVSRRLLDLDAETNSIDAVLSGDALLAPSVHAAPGMRLPGTVDAFELAVRAILGQQITVRAARTMAGRIVHRAGTQLHPGGQVEGITHLFPIAEQLAAASLEGLGLTRRRVATIRHMAQLAAGGDLVLTGTDRDTIRKALLAIPGIGPWTTEYIAMRALRDADAFPTGDVGIRDGCRALGLPTSAAAIAQHAERWRPYRGYAVMHLWNGSGHLDEPT